MRCPRGTQWARGAPCR